MRALTKLFASHSRRAAALALVLLLAGIGAGHAQTGADDDGYAPPSRVARLSWSSGELGLLPSGAHDWSDASVNRPLTTGDKLSSGDDSRAELELGGATLRLAQRTDMGLLDLDEQLAQIELTQGTLSLSVRQLDQGQSYEIDTPTVALVIDQPGRVRVDIDGGATRVTVFDGKATVYGENDAQRDVFAGRSYRFIDSSLAAIAISDIDGGDDFDAWVEQRDQRYAQSRSSQYVSPEVVGYQDLDHYGEWQDDSDYGPVWYPGNVAVDWAPYRDGRWAYIAPWGWTWIDAMPWGYAPYHYGRWAHTHRGWGWIPGPRYARPIYAPALVAFVGGGGFSVGIGSGPVGWFPLGPGEVYNPWYRCDRDYYRRVNINNIRVTRNITNVVINERVTNHYGRYRNNRPFDEHYANRYAPRGITAMSAREFAAGAGVQRHQVRLDPARLASTRVAPRGVDMIRPLPRDAVNERSAHVRNLPTGGFQRQVVARRAPPAMPADLAARPDNARPQARPVSNVRLLTPRRAEMSGVARGEPRRPPVRTADAAPETLPVPNRVTPAAPAPREELRSARFAHPQDRRRGEPAVMPRPGVSYISPADRNEASLPRVAPVRRADTGEQATLERDAQRRDYRFSQPRAQPIERARPEPRFERADVARPAYVREPPRELARPSYERAQPREITRPAEVREPPRPQPVYREPPRQATPPPRQQAPQYTPPPRQAPPPVRAEVQRARQADHRQNREL
ncbi:DUF6600 domain-containing protein [Rhodanobacter lindaniclasticus]